MSPLFASANRVRVGSDGAWQLRLTDTFQNGWAEFAYLADEGTSSASAVPASLSSLAGSTATNLATGAVTTGAFRVFGLPVVGFMTRTYSNGGLTCAAGRCQGNYAAAFPHNGVRRIEALP